MAWQLEKKEPQHLEKSCHMILRGICDDWLGIRWFEKKEAQIL